MNVIPTVLSPVFTERLQGCNQIELRGRTHLRSHQDKAPRGLSRACIKDSKSVCHPAQYAKYTYIYTCRHICFGPTDSHEMAAHVSTDPPMLTTDSAHCAWYLICAD